MRKGRKPRCEYSADQMMLNVASSLVRDFRTNLNDESFCSNLLASIKARDIAQIRSSTPEVDDQMDPAKYKASYQMASVFKRYRFRKDLYSDQELTEKAIQSFLDTQDRIKAVDWEAFDAKTNAILDLASIYVAKVLGPYSDEEHRALCRFGRKASVGVPARLACEAARWELPISGSPEQISWFDSEMSQIASVQEYWMAQKAENPEKDSTYQEVSSLTLALVPKTFKSLRAIMPNTTIGSYMSFGLGEIMRKRLRREGYDIRTLQERHRYLARSASVHGLWTTADLSAASDSISVALVERLFPSDWLEILSQSRIGNVTLPNGQTVESYTFCTMGIGYTFPLQTLVFLSLLKAIQAYYYSRSDRRLVSVYGDDLIYASRMHGYVVEVFESLGFVINLDKTFHEGHFRESCGGDYYHGVDVRPFQPRNGSVSVSPKAYEAILYKFVNTLLARWSEYEIGETLAYLVTEIEHVTGKAKLVPFNYPDDAGIKCASPMSPGFYLRHAKVAKPESIGHGLFRFSFLRHVPNEMKEDRHVPYLWLALRGGCIPVHYATGHSHQEQPGFLTKLISEVCGIRGEHSPLYRREDKPIKTFRGITGRRLRRVSTFVALGQGGRYVRQSGISCFGIRR